MTDERSEREIYCDKQIETFIEAIRNKKGKANGYCQISKEESDMLMKYIEAGTEATLERLGVKQTGKHRGFACDPFLIGEEEDEMLKKVYNEKVKPFLAS